MAKLNIKEWAAPVIAIICFYLLLNLMGAETTCFFKATIGIPCPGCGMTRAYIALLHGDIKKAFYFHPLFVIPAIIAIIFIVPRFRKYRNSIPLWTLVCIIFIATWIVRMKLLFPNIAPMDYYNGAMIPKLISMFLKIFK